MVMDQEISRLAKDAPALRHQHLLNLAEAAKSNDDVPRFKAIVEMMEREDQKKQWGNINRSTCLPRGRNPLAIQVETPTSTVTYDTEQSVFDHATAHLTTQFQLAYTALIYSTSLLNDISNLGNTQCALNFLDGTYKFPPDTDK